MGPVIAEDARQKIAALPEVERAKVHIVWDPIWNPRMISDGGAARASGWSRPSEPARLRPCTVSSEQPSASSAGVSQLGRAMTPG